MKRIFLSIVLVFLLSSCSSNGDADLEYDEANFVFEVNETVDVRAYLRWKNTIIINDHDIDYSTIGEYVLYVTDVDTEIVYEIPVIIEDTIAPELTIPEDFDAYYQVGSEIDFSGFVVTDNSLEEIDITTNMDQIDMNVLGEYSLVVTAQDSTGNLTVTSIPITVRNVIYPIINVDVYDVSDASFKVRFTENDPNQYKVESRYSITQNGTIISEGTITDDLIIDVPDLLQSTEYRVVLYYTFLIPGEDQKIMSKSVFVTTDNLFEPIIELEDVIITNETLSFTVGTIDPDELLGDILITIVDEEGTVVLQRYVAEEPNFDLTGLDLQDEYTITVAYSYDMADGNGLQGYTDVYTYQILQ